MQQVTATLAQYKPISAWKPQVGDSVFQHGLLTHWFGIVTSVDRTNGYGKATIVKAGMPVLLVTMHDAEMEKNKIEIPVADILTSKGGKYAVLQTAGNTTVWYV